jgi:16S rRNA (uracil1498-N3)-methyltransferase
MAERFYTNCPLSPGPVVLQGPEAHHLAAVCRARPGDEVCLFNGDGREYPARILSVDKRTVTLEVFASLAPRRELPVSVEVASPLPKGDRAQFLLEKLTELGVSRFVPLETGRSVVHPREAKLEKLQRYVIEACKQCGRNVLLQVEPLTKWETYCRASHLAPYRILAHPGEGRKEDDNAECAQVKMAGRFPFAFFERPQDVALAVGPEGGFTNEEVAVAKAAGWQVANLGPRILRVETAALVLAAWLALFNS